MKKILFVEDNNLIARIYSQKLAGVGFNVAVAPDGLEAIKMLPEFEPDLVVLDLLMPRMTGADVLKFLRGHPTLKSTPVIVFSNSFLSNLVEQISTMKVEATLVKAAVNPTRLVEVINATLGGTVAPVTAEKTVEAPAAATVPVPVASVRAAAVTPLTPAKVVKPAKPTAPAAVKKPEPTPAVSETDSEFVKRIGQQFLQRAPIVFKELRDICREILDAAKTPAEVDHLAALNRKLGFLTQITGMAGYHQTAELSSALEALLFDLVNKPALINDATRQTIIVTIAFLADRFDKLEPAVEQCQKVTTALVVDDDAVSNLAVEQSLSRAKFSVTNITDSGKGLEKLKQTQFDVLLLDIAMPGMDGFALCEAARQLPLHKQTPVIFITGRTDFNSYARSILSGGNDLITKPILANELCVKVITHVLKSK